MLVFSGGGKGVSGGEGVGRDVEAAGGGPGEKTPLDAYHVTIAGASVVAPC